MRTTDFDRPVHLCRIPEIPCRRGYEGIAPIHGMSVNGGITMPSACGLNRANNYAPSAPSSTEELLKQLERRLQRFIGVGTNKHFFSEKDEWEIARSSGVKPRIRDASTFSRFYIVSRHCQKTHPVCSCACVVMDVLVVSLCTDEHGIQDVVRGELQSESSQGRQVIGRDSCGALIRNIKPQWPHTRRESAPPPTIQQPCVKLT